MKNIVISLKSAKELLIWILAWLAAKGYTRTQKSVISISSETYILWGTYILVFCEALTRKNIIFSLISFPCWGLAILNLPSKQTADKQGYSTPVWVCA